MVATKVARGDGEVLAAEAPEPPPRDEVEQRPGDEQQQRGDRRHRDQRQQRRAHGDEQQQPERREHRCQRRARAGLVVRQRAVERAARHVRREHAADEVRQALAAELAVGVDVLARALGHGLGDRDRLAEGDDGEREGDADQVGQGAQVESGTTRCGQIGGIAPTTAIGRPVAGSQRPSANANAVAPTMPSSMCGERGSQRFSASDATIVTRRRPPARRHDASKRWIHRSSARLPRRCALGAARPSRSGKA